MFRTAFSLVMLGFLIIGATTVAYGTFFDKGFVTSAAAVLGAGEDEHAGHHRGDDDD